MTASDDERRLTAARARLAAQAASDPAARSSGARLGRMLAAEPELTSPTADEAGRETATRFVQYLTADGFDMGAMITRMERLKFEVIVTGKTYAQVLAEMEEQ